MTGARVAVILALCARAALAQPADAERYYKEGQAAYDARRYDDAIAAWDKSYALSHLPALVYNLAQAHRLRGDCADAVAAYKKFLELDAKSPQRASAEGFIKDLEPCQASEPQPPEPPPLQPPAPAPQPPPAAVHTTVVGHGNRAARIAGVGLVVAGVAAAGVGAYFGDQASSLASQVRAACANGCDYDSIKSKDQTGRSDQTLQYVFYGAGAAAAVAGVILYVVGREHPAVVIAPTAGGAAVSWSRAFW